MNAQKWLTGLLEKAGITPNGPNPWDPQIHNPELYKRVRWQGTMGVGESYMEGWWDCEQIDELFYRAVRSGHLNSLAVSLPSVILAARALLTNPQSKERAFKIGKRHYDIGNELFAAMLGPTMAYSCAYWKNATTLDQAQLNKFDLIYNKLYLEKGMTVLDVGCGWGGLANHMATNYGVKVIGLTVSREQVEYARTHYSNRNIDIRFQDYRTFTERVDRVVSVGMWEHIGPKNSRRAMKLLRQCLPDDGLLLLHTIVSPWTVWSNEPWMEENIFPNSQLPSTKQLARDAERLFIIEDVHNLSANYDPTLMAWLTNYRNSRASLKQPFDEKFHRSWELYLPSCAGGFRARAIQLLQLVLSPKGVLGGYQSIR